MLIKGNLHRNIQQIHPASFGSIDFSIRRTLKLNKTEFNKLKGPQASFMPNRWYDEVLMKQLQS
jgi:hypothetical protein